ncbi:MAG: hypothetical protein ABL896_06570 [Hylemonella sp.]
MKMIRIPYSLPMAQARRAGLKTQTRRQIKASSRFDVWPPSAHPQHLEYFRSVCPYGQPGDILLPIEPWRTLEEFDSLPPREILAGTPIWLDANGPAPDYFGRYRHARFMPKHLIKARDELVEVRVERLQDISESDAKAEGLYQDTAGRWTTYSATEAAREHLSPVQAYLDLWEHLNGPGSWDANPWVWVLTFKRITA